MNIIRCFLIIILIIITGCTKDKISGSDDSGDSNDSSSDSSESAELIELSEIISNPSDQFIIDSDGLEKVYRAHPYKGAEETCSHTGAHLIFTTEGAPYTVDVYAPVDGVITQIRNCVDLENGNDKYDILLEFANHQGSTVSLSFSLEPFGGYLCQDDENYYNQYIFVEEEQNVKKGDLIAQLYKPGGDTPSTHICFSLSSALANRMHCPNIFNASVVSDFADVLGGETCDGDELGETLCYKPADGEDLTGL